MPNIPTLLRATKTRNIKRSLLQIDGFCFHPKYAIFPTQLKKKEKKTRETFYPFSSYPTLFQRICGTDQ